MDLATTIQVSGGESITDTKNLKEYSLTKIVERIKFDPVLQEQIEAIRATQDKKERKKLKSKLPYFCPGVFKNRQNADFQQADFLLFDFDDIGDASALKERMKKDVYIAFLSPSGNGVKAIFWLNQPITDVNQYYATYQYYIEDLTKRYGVSPDKATCDPSRATGLSHDTNIIVNDNPEYILKIINTPAWVKKEIQQYQDVPHFMQDLIEYLRPYMTDYDTWFRLGMALASLGEKGREFFVLLSRDNPNYRDSERDINRKYDSFLRDHGKAGFDKENGRLLTLPYILSFAKKQGYKLPSKSRSTAFSLTENYLSLYYEFMYNVLEQKLFVKEKFSGEEFREMSDRDLNSIFKKIVADGSSIAFENYKRILDSDYVPEFHPVLDFFERIKGQWTEGDHDYITDLAFTVVATDMGHWMSCLRKWLIATVAGALSGSEINHTCLILQSDQGVGKSRWFGNILPPDMKRYIFTGTISHRDKDSKIAVLKNFIINLDELEGFDRDDISYLKALMTQKIIEIRKPYGHYELKTLRRSSICGSVNKTAFINDITGTRRFLVFSTEKIDYDHSIDMNKVWAQALYLYQHGERYWFDTKEVAELDVKNDDYKVVSMEEELLTSKFETCNDEHSPQAVWLTTTEITQKIIPDAKGFNVQKVGAIMTAKKWYWKRKKTKTNNVVSKVWLVKYADGAKYEDVI